MAAAAIELCEVYKEFGGGVRAVDGVSLDIRPGELVTLLGPSGSGKTTVLRLIAGFEDLDGGDILIGGGSVGSVPTHRRRLGMVAQDYALFPHLSVKENLAFGLRTGRWSRSSGMRRDRHQIDRAIAAMLETVGLQGLEARMPHQLSGGQKQRVALARALVTEPRVLLLDEPFAALDKHLREQLQVEVRRVQRQVGTTTVFVTHDQNEALSMSDRIAVMHGGRLEQYDTPSALYNHPATRFVAGFVGRTNFLEGPVVRRDRAHVRVQVADGVEVTVAADGAAAGRDRLDFAVRPERLTVAAEHQAAPPDGNRLTGTVSAVRYLGEATHLTVDTPAGAMQATITNRHANEAPRRLGDRVEVVFAADACTVLHPTDTADASA